MSLPTVPPPERGEVWWCEAPQIGRRPVVVISRAAAIAGRRHTMIVPCTTTLRGLPSEVELTPGEDPVPKRCVASLDGVENVPIVLLTERLGRLGDLRMHEICAALSVAVDC